MPDNFVILPRAMSPALAALTGGYQDPACRS
jgi:hypothetical protein